MFADLYIHSNYKPPEADFPTKIATGDPIASIEDIAMNIIFDKYPSESELDELRADL